MAKKVSEKNRLDVGTRLIRQIVEIPLAFCYGDVVVFKVGGQSGMVVGFIVENNNHIKYVVACEDLVEREVTEGELKLRT
jgi:hypothetical protein